MNPVLRCSVVTIFPDIIKSYLSASIMKRAVAKGLISASVHDLRDHTTDRHRTVDDYPYGGGAGMVMKPDPFFRIANQLWPDREKRRIILLSPKGRLFTQQLAKELVSDSRELVFFCGRYEAIDERVHRYLADDEISIGDYVLTGGELPALVIIDAVARLVPGVLDYPHYTRPEVLDGMNVPEVLLSGNHQEIDQWRRRQALTATRSLRPDVFAAYRPSEEDEKILKEIKEDS